MQEKLKPEQNLNQKNGASVNGSQPPSLSPETQTINDIVNTICQSIGLPGVIVVSRPEMATIEGVFMSAKGDDPYYDTLPLMQDQIYLIAAVGEIVEKTAVPPGYSTIDVNAGGHDQPNKVTDPVS